MDVLSRIKELQENFPNYKIFRRKQIFDMRKEVVDCQKEVSEYEKQGDKYAVSEMQKNIQQTKDVIQRQEELSKCERLPTLEDYEYRDRQRREFSSQIKGIISNDDNLCFHGTNIVAAKHIIESGSISSGASRLGYHISFDGRGSISVTNIQMVETSVCDYMNLTGNFISRQAVYFLFKLGIGKRMNVLLLQCRLRILTLGMILIDWWRL